MGNCPTTRIFIMVCPQRVAPSDATVLITLVKFESTTRTEIESVIDSSYWFFLFLFGFDFNQSTIPSFG